MPERNRFYWYGENKDGPTHQPDPRCGGLTRYLQGLDQGVATVSKPKAFFNVYLALGGMPNRESFRQFWKPSPVRAARLSAQTRLTPGGVLHQEFVL